MNVKQAVVGTLASLGASAAMAAVVTFTSAGGMIIPGAGSSGPGSPNPLALTVSGVFGTVIDVNVTLIGLTHTYADDLNFGIVGPTGARLYLMADAGGSGGYNNTTLTFDDEAAAAIQDEVLPGSGSYRVSRYGNVETFGPPAPAFDFTGNLSRFDGLNPNGTWQLFGFDDAGADVGSLRAFSITFTTEASPIPAPSTLALIAAAMTGLALSRRQRRA